MTDLLIQLSDPLLHFLGQLAFLSGCVELYIVYLFVQDVLVLASQSQMRKEELTELYERETTLATSKNVLKLEEGSYFFRREPAATMDVASQEALQAQIALTLRIQYAKRNIRRLVHDGEGLAELLPSVGDKVLPAELLHEFLFRAGGLLELT